ncbi:MAG TPA: hypothetical protein VGW57_15510 [Chthoniobacterales bacterium]|nr:hypothetical protein [Chthoniobacterales bacterium]
MHAQPVMGVSGSKSFIEIERLQLEQEIIDKLNALICEDLVRVGLDVEENCEWVLVHGAVDTAPFFGKYPLVKSGKGTFTESRELKLRPSAPPLPSAGAAIGIWYQALPRERGSFVAKSQAFAYTYHNAVAIA